MTTRSSTVDPYIVVLDVQADVVRALLFDSEARRVEGYSATLPRRAAAPADFAADCLDEMHRLVHADGFRVAAVVGRAEEEVSAEDRKCWPAFEGAKWFAAIPEGSDVILGIAGRDRFGLVVTEKSMVGTVVENQPRELPKELTCVPIDEQRWLLSGAVPEAGGAYAVLKHDLKLTGSLEKYLETAAPEDPHLAGLESAARRFREVYNLLLTIVKEPAEIVAAGPTLLSRQPGHSGSPIRWACR